MTIRKELPADIDAIHRLNQAAFGQNSEADLVDRLRARGKVTLSLVAEKDGRVVGHILFSPVTIERKGGIITIQGLAPMAVLPQCQKCGIGSRLVEQGLALLKETGQRAVVVLGHLGYYPRFGFIPASRFGITNEYDAPDNAFLALELSPGGLRDCPGLAKFQPEFAAAA